MSRPRVATLASLLVTSAGLQFGCHPQSQPETESVDPASVRSGAVRELDLLLSTPTSGLRVQYARQHFPEGRVFEPPVTNCQDVLFLVRSGRVEVRGPGLAPEGEATILGPNDAARFGATGGTAMATEGDAVVQLGFVRSAARPLRGTVREIGEAIFAPPEHPDCGEPRQPNGNRSRVAIYEETEEHEVAGGKLRVRILFDAASDRRGRGYGTGEAGHGALSLLRGAPDLAVPSHEHPDSAEALVIERGEGTMPIGDQTVRIEPNSVIYVPPGVTHGLTSSGTLDLQAIQIYAPPGPEQRFRGPREPAP